MCCLLWRIYEMHPVLSLKSGCDTLDVRASSLPEPETTAHLSLSPSPTGEGQAVQEEPHNEEFDLI